MPQKKRPLEERIKFDGSRMTKPRKAILKVLDGKQTHLTAEDIYLEVHKFYPNIGLTTVYRNLEFLTDREIISRICFTHGKTKYELSEEYSTLGHHHHLVCDHCTKIINYNDFMREELEFLKIVEKGLAKRYNFKITHHSIQFNGLCQECLKMEN